MALYLSCASKSTCMTKVIPMHALAQIENHAAIVEADVIVAVDADSRGGIVVFGRDVLVEALQREERQKINLLEVELDADSEELGQLIALVIYLRGDPDAL